MVMVTTRQINVAIMSLERAGRGDWNLTKGLRELLDTMIANKVTAIDLSELGEDLAKDLISLEEAYTRYKAYERR